VPTPTPDSEPRPTLPIDIHRALVDTLFRTVGSFLAGIAGASIVPIVAYARTGSGVFVGCGAALAVLAAVRIGVFLAYVERRRRGLSLDPKLWDRLYALGAIGFMTAVGITAALLFQQVPDEISRMYALLICIGCAGALASRNAARPYIVYGQVLGVCGPLALALALQPSPWFWGLAVMLLLVMVSVKSTTKFLNQMFVAALLENRERRAAAAALVEAKEAAEAASTAKSAFLATMSHEIRTPLNAVLGMTQAMAADRLGARQRQRLEIIQSAGEALLTVLNDVLDISKIEAGTIELEDGLVDLERLALSAQSTFSSLAREKDLYLKVEVEPAARGLWRGDPARIRQILHNLVANAVKFTQRGWVEIAVRREGTWIALTVSDTGPGIPPERQAQVFDRFAQADASTTRRYGGTGLGLAICRELSGLMGGEIGLASAVGRGSAFTVRLPLARAEPAAESAAPARTRRRTETPLAGLRILAAEDNHTNQLVLRTLLGQLGLEPAFVENGEEAVAAWEQAAWDVILMDVQMPAMDGPTATRVIRERERARGLAPVPIIALTANAMSHHAEEYRRAGMDALVPKPINLGELVEAIQRVTRAAARPAPAARSAAKSAARA